MATTSPDGLWSPDLATGFNPVTDFANMQTSVQEALNLRANMYRGTGAERVAFGPQAAVGTVWQDTDTDQQMYIWTGNSWAVHRRQPMNITYKKMGSDLPGIHTGGPSLPDHPELWVQTGFFHGVSVVVGGDSFIPQFSYPKPFPNFTASISIMQIHRGGAVASNNVAIADVTRTLFRVVYPGQPNRTERAFLWTAIGG